MNSSSAADLLNHVRVPLTCDSSFDIYMELAKYLIQLFYTSIGIVLQILIIKTIAFRKDEAFRDNPYYTLYLVDCCWSLTYLISESIFVLPGIYITPICHFFESLSLSSSSSVDLPLFIYKCNMMLSSHCIPAKCVSQIFLSLNRMTCVAIPVSHKGIWKSFVPLAIFLIMSLPVLSYWHLFPAQVYYQPNYGGFSVNYIKTIPWASLSMFLLIFIISTLISTIIFTLLTLLFLLKMSIRVKDLERSLTIATIITSLNFMIVAGFQIIFAFNNSILQGPIVYTLNHTILEFFCICPAVVMLLANRQLRERVFNNIRRNESQMTVVPSSQLITTISR